MKTYSLFLHFKQGDDFASIRKSTKTNSVAFEKWASQFAHYQAICTTVAKALDGKKVEISADTHMIMLVPGDAAGARALEALVKERILTRSDD